MNYQDKTKDQLIKDLQELRLNHNSLKESYEKVLAENMLEKDKLQQQILNSEAMFESSPIAMFVIDDTTNIVMTNLAFVVMCGGSESDILQHRPGNALRCVHSPIDSRGCGYASECKFCNVRNGVENLIANGGSLHGAELELELIRNGVPGKYWVNIGVEPIMMNGHRHWCIAMDDVTERKKLENKLLEEQAFRNSIESSLSSGIAIVDDEGRQIYVNPYFCKLIGWSAEELTGKTAPYVYWPANQLQAIGEAFQLTLANMAPPEGFELVFMRQDGTHFPVQVIISPFNNGKQKTGWLANVIDISERKKAEKMLQESQQKLYEAHKLAHIGIWDWNAENDTVIWSDELYQIAGCDPKLPAPTFAEHSKIYAPHSLQILKTAVENAMRTGEKYELELTQVHSTGKQRIVTAFGGAKFDAMGKITGLFGTIQDITERKEAEEKIKKLSRIYALLGNINQTIVRTRDKQLLLNEVCRIAVDGGGFLMAWIGMINTATNKVDVTASSGMSGDYLDKINIDLLV